VFALYLAGKTLRGIAARLTDEGVPSPGRSQNGWHYTVISRMLSNRAYFGEARAWRSVDRPSRRDNGTGPAVLLPAGAITAIIDTATFDAVQSRLWLNKKLATRNNADPESSLLRGGFIICGHCDRPMHVGARYRPGGPRRYGCNRTSRGTVANRCPPN